MTRYEGLMPTTRVAQSHCPHCALQDQVSVAMSGDSCSRTCSTIVDRDSLPEILVSRLVNPSDTASSGLLCSGLSAGRRTGFIPQMPPKNSGSIDSQWDQMSISELVCVTRDSLPGAEEMLMLGKSTIDRNKSKAEKAAIAAGHVLGPWGDHTAGTAVAHCRAANCVWWASAYEAGGTDTIPVPRCPLTAGKAAANRREDLGG